MPSHSIIIGSLDVLAGGSVVSDPACNFHAMPRYHDALLGVDPETGGSRFTTRPAIAIGVGEYPDGANAEEVIRSDVGDWILARQPELGEAAAVDGSAGRGASAWIPVVQWLGEAIANNVVDIGVGYALAKTIGRLRGWAKGREGEGRAGGFEVSRGAAAALAAADLAEQFDEQGPLEVEAVEEPSNIAGYEATELSYVGLEPWIVLLRNMNEQVRYVVVVLPDGAIAGRLRVPFLDFEAGYLPPSEFNSSATR
jgi:hypothetical protein